MSDEKLKKDLNKIKQPLATGGAVVNYRDSWRIFRIIAEFVDGYQFLGELSKEVVILGSARLPSNNKYNKIAVELGRLLGKNGFTTITGGGPGIMEAANKGAYEAGGESVGLNIQLPFEQRINPYVKKAIAFYYFFTRKTMLTSPANAFVFFPGGFGTLDVFFEVVDNIEMGFMKRSPIVLVGSDFWKPIVEFVRNKSSKEVGSVPDSEIDEWKIVDTASEAFEYLKDIKDRPNVCDSSDIENPLCEGGADWRVFRIMAELVDGFEFISKVKENVTVLGTKSIKQDSKYYNQAYLVGKELAMGGYATMTGGGPGTMEAASKGAFENGGESIGINMRFSHGKERHNDYLTDSIGFFFPYIRKLIITSPSKGFVYFPGGFGTMHQLFEILTLQETGKIEKIPTLLYGKDFWQPMLDIIDNLYSEFKTISKDNIDLIKLIDKPEDVLGNIEK